MPQEAVRAFTPVGRIIWGSVHERQKEDYDGNAYPAGEGPIQFGLAVLKTDPEIGALLGLIYQTAVAGYPNNQHMKGRIDNEWNSGFANGQFRFKIKDGDKPNTKGVVNPNGKGCWVIAFQSFLPVKCGNTMNQEIDPKAVKTGYYVDIAMSTKVNDKMDGTAGVYMNPNVVRLVAFGEEITGGPSVEEAFAGRAAPSALPPGASLAPKAPANSPPGGGLPVPGGSVDANFTNPPVQTPQNNGAPPNGLPMPGGTSTTQSPSNVPTNPVTGQPVMPHQTFAGGPGLPGGGQ